jgi:hypothetical protein
MRNAKKTAAFEGHHSVNDSEEPPLTLRILLLAALPHSVNSVNSVTLSRCRKKTSSSQRAQQMPSDPVISESYQGLGIDLSRRG